MHMQGNPRTMQANPTYADVVMEVSDFFAERLTTLASDGIPPEAVCLDPGIGFGKTLTHTLSQLNRLAEYQRFARPVCLGVSRKGFIGHLLGGRGVEDRLFGTAAAVALAVAGGARLIRAHDVAAMSDVVRVAEVVARA